MNILQGHFNGTGAACVLQLGAIPYQIKFWGLEGATPDTVIWDRTMIHDLLTPEGIMRPTGGGAVVDYALSEGVRPYFGGETLDSSNQTSVTYGEGVYLERDDKDYRYYTNAAAGIVGDAENTTITTWTLDTAASNSGHFNDDVVGTYIGAGSIIIIQETDVPNRQYFPVAINTLSAAAGSIADSVVLSYPVPSGRVTFIGGMNGYSPSPLGTITKPGMKINLTSTPFVNDEMVAFSALMP